MRKTRKIAAKIQSIITCFVLFMSVFFYAGMNVEASSSYAPPVRLYINGDPLYSFSRPEYPYSVVFRLVPVGGVSDLRQFHFPSQYYIYSQGEVSFSNTTENGIIYGDEYFFFDTVISSFVDIYYDTLPGFDNDYFSLAGGLSFPISFSAPDVIALYFWYEPLGLYQGDYSLFQNGDSLYFTFSSDRVYSPDLGAILFSFNLHVVAVSKSYVTPSVTISMNGSIPDLKLRCLVPSQSDYSLDGYKNSNMSSSSVNLNNSLSGYEQAEGSLFTSANQGVGSFQMQSLNTPALVSSMSFVSTFLQSIYTSSGGLNGLGLLPAVVFTFTFASIVVGLYRYYGGGKSG